MAGVFSDPAKANQVIHDAASDTTGKRMTVIRDGNTTYSPYTNGVEVIMEKTAEGDGKRLKEVRTVTRVNVPRQRFSGFGEATYDRKLIYHPEEEAKETT